MKLEPIDIAPFALPNTPSNEVWFEEPRDIARVAAEFEGKAPDDIEVYYRRKVWPDVRLEGADTAHPGGFGWEKQDDWFNGDWTKAAIKVAREGERRVSISFQGLTAEMPERKDYDVTFRRTLALKIDAPAGAAVKKMAAFTASAPTESVLRVTLDAGHATPGKMIQLSGYNAEIGTISPVHNVSAQKTEVFY